MEEKLPLFERLMPRNKTTRMMILLLVDIVLLSLSCFVALWSRFDLSLAAVPEHYLHNALIYLPLYVVVSVMVFYAFRLYSYMWSVAGMREAVSVVLATGFSMLFQICGMHLLNLHMPRSYYIICFFVITILEGVFRFSFRIHRSVRSMLAARRQVSDEKPAERIMLVGAGVAGADILKEIRGSGHVVGDVVCFIDDEKNKVGRFINGVKIVGTRKDIPEMVKRYAIDWIYITMPSASREERSQIAKICQETGVKTKTLPGIYQLVNGEVSVSRLRNVSIEDLLGRDPIEADFEKITTYLKDKVVLVTGGGGSIGSELCRQIAKAEPKKLIVFDIYENSVYELQHELHFQYPNLDAEYLIGSVRNIHRMDTIFEQYRPEIVFHAAAHKHVPLMEDSPNEAIKNNVFGTYNTAVAAIKYGTKKFVLISTDKAVNPTNIMGASKRLCEMIIQMLSRRKTGTDFVAVRFGNVLGSNGSVIPLFKKQIEAGGPVTVTHPEIIRFFMTIPEAVGLVLEAGATAKGGEIFVLDMGEPVKILDLARNMIRMSGYKPDVDIKIEFTGLRPGEKLFEETLMDEEGLTDTDNKLIHIAKPIEFDDDQFNEDLKGLKAAAKEDSNIIKKGVAELVPTYNPKYQEELRSTGILDIDEDDE